MTFANQEDPRRQMLIQQLMAPKRESDSSHLDFGALGEPLANAYMMKNMNGPKPNMGGQVNAQSMGNPQQALMGLPMGGAVNAASRGVPGQIPQQGLMAKFANLFGG